MADLFQKGKIEFETAYKEAMKFLPKPNDMLDIDTDLELQSISFFMQKTRKNPIVLLHGRSAATLCRPDNLKVN